jgi:ATP-binding cassette subfamily G (WHITE) protein 2 (SNQ2)
MSDLERVTKRDESVDSLPAAPETAQPNDVQASPNPGRGRASSRVTVGYFDRAGVDQLRQTLTRLSENRDPENPHALSSETLSVPATGPFDFERTLRNIMKKYVIVPTPSIIPH